ncbi:MAG: alpha/beta fold hydrolase [Desulfobacteraceae bacterium]|nr:alpha/beta fold hydrolase [Desulfobacteraceae bacterium]
MNPFAFELSSYTLKTFSGFSKASIRIKGRKNIPDGSVIFCANHFTRIETIFLPYHIHSITKKQVWSLAAKELFEIPVLEGFLNKLGAVSTHDPNRDELILQTLLSGNVQWIIFPEGMMVKNKKLIKNNNFSLTDDQGVSRPHTGAAALALRCEFFRERLRRLFNTGEPEFDRLVENLKIADVDQVLAQTTRIVPVNITYYPGNARENIMGTIAKIVMKEPSKRVIDELMTEGGMLFSGVDITIRFGDPIEIKPYLNDPYIESMLMVKRRVRFGDDLSSKQISKKISNGIMERYMSSVYAMTTLNYDHVMACILKHFPYKKEGINIYEFQCKVYYAITCLLLQKICYVCDILHQNLIHLLINDRFDRIKRFLSLAEKTQVIQIKGDRFFKDQTRFFIHSDFHAIRTENPVLVMANEVEPVTAAEICLKKIAQKSGSRIRELVKGRLREKMNVDFSLAYNTHYIEGESKKKRIGKPLFLKHDNEIAGVLLIHGYMAAPEEMKSFALYLHEQGFTVFAPRLAGHGTSPEDLAGTTYEEWVESVEEAYVVLRHSCDKIIIGGFSTGAGLALELSCRVDDCEAIFAVAPPMQLNDLGSYFVPAIDRWNVMIKKIRLSGIAKEFLENNPENAHINYIRNPIAGIHQLEILMEQLGPKLKAIEKPVLVVQSRKDPVVSPKGTQKLFKKLGSKVKEYYLFDYDRHGILTGKGVERVFQSIENFIRQWV